MTGITGLASETDIGALEVVGCLRYTVTPVITAATTTTGTAMATAVIAGEVDPDDAAGAGVVVEPGRAVMPPPPPGGDGAAVVDGGAGAWVVPPTTCTAALFGTNVMGTVLPAESVDWKSDDTTWAATALASSCVSRAMVTTRTYPLTARSLLRMTWETTMDMRAELMERLMAIFMRRAAISAAVGVATESYLS